VPRVIGIDLGTTNTLAAWADGRVPRIVPTERGHNLVPSVVAVAGGRIVVGHPARDQLLIHPASTITGSKRLLGRPFSSPVVQRLKRKLAWEVVEGAHGTAAARVRQPGGGGGGGGDDGGEVHELTDVSAVLLQQIARYAAAHLHGHVDGAVVSVPAYYPLTQREAVRTAAKAAGIDVWRLVNEPTAAALAYGIGRNINQKLLVFDLGGGTFDVSVLEVQGGTFQVLATGGDGALGGVDFDIRLCDHLLDRFEQDHGVSVRDDATVVQRVLFAAETAKQDLSLLQHTEVRLPFVKETKRGKPLDLATHVSRLQLVKLTEDLIERAAAAVDDVLASAGLSHREIDEVLLAGGQTRMPAIHARLEKQFGRPPRRGVNPDEVVAQGAALLARSLSSNAVQLYDVLSLAVGTVGIDPKTGTQRVQTVLPKNAQLPVEAVVDVVTGPSRRVDLFQLPDSRETDPALCEPLGGVLLSDKQPGDPATLTLRIDADTRLEIKEGNRVLELRAGRSDDAFARKWPGTDPQMVPTTSTSLLSRLFRR
jgi:molecular chaperone DnaK